MSNKITFELAGLTCQFSDFRYGSGFDNWQWKLDPYKSTSAKTPDILISEEIHTTVTAEQNTLIAEESAGFFSHRLYDIGNGHLIWNYEDSNSRDIMLSYDFCLDDNRITLLQDMTNSVGTLAEEYLGRILVPIFIKFGVLTIHGVLMEYNGQGIIISAPSGTGKTTHARMWRDYRNALILNGDRATVRKIENTWYGYGLPWSGTSGEQINRKVPIKAVVVLERDSENKAWLLDEINAFEAVLAHIQAPAWDKELSEKVMDLVMALLADVPVIHLGCTPDQEAVHVLELVLEKLPNA